jgi:uncharacterized membrane protein YgdD (TMEM256/DUF423 family)
VLDSRFQALEEMTTQHNQLFFGLGCLFAFVGVAAGAFGAHTLKGRLDSEMLTVFDTAVRYQIYHSMGLLLVGLAVSRFPTARLHLSGWLFAAGILLFSGSLYVLALTGVKWLGAITPLGGVAFLGGWGSLGWMVWRAGRNPE